MRDTTEQYFKRVGDFLCLLLFMLGCLAWFIAILQPSSNEIGWNAYEGDQNALDHLIFIGVWIIGTGIVWASPATGLRFCLWNAVVFALVTALLFSDFSPTTLLGWA